MEGRRPKAHTFMSAQAATGQGTTMLVKDYRHITVAIATASSANLTIKCVGSIAATEPTFTSAQSSTNVYDFIGMYKYEDAALIEGDTGVVLAGTDDIALYTVNVDGLIWLNFRVTAYSTGNVTVNAVGYTNQ